MAIDPSFIYTIGAGLAGGGIAWGGISAQLKGVISTQSDVKDDLAKHTAADTVVQLDLVSRLARIEGKLDALRSK